LDISQSSSPRKLDMLAIPLPIEDDSYDAVNQ
jgi:hypothetical protein